MSNSGKSFVLGLIVLLVNVSCDVEHEVDYLNRVALDFENSNPIKASEIFDDFEYLLLEENPSLPLVRPYKILFQDSLIFVEDKDLNNLFIFNYLGEIQHILQSLGEGPREFIQIDEFSVSENKIYIQDDFLKKTLVYSIDGEFIEEIFHRNYGFSKFYWKGKEFIYFDNFDLNKADFHVKKGSEIITSIDINRLDNDLPPVSQKHGFLPHFTNLEVSFVVPYSYKVMLFGLNDPNQKIIEFDFGEFNFPQEEYKRFLRDQWNNKDLFIQNKYVSMISYFGPLKKEYLLSVSHGLGDPHWFVLDRDFKVKLQFRIKDLENDIDGWQLNSSIASSFDDNIVLHINSNEFYNRVEKTLETKSSLVGNMKDFWDQHREELLDDRLVLVFLKMKRN